MTQKNCNTLSILAGLVIFADTAAQAETISIVVASNAAPRVEFGAEKLVEALKGVKLDAAMVHSENVTGRKIHLETPSDSSAGQEGFRIDSTGNDDLVVTAGDDSGMLYGCLELARRIRDEGKVPTITNFADKPAFTLRGACIGMQKTYILPGRHVYEYPYT
ncbi:MAG: alpha-d-galacturonidase, partial [Limisphaerales bacterium]